MMKAKIQEWWRSGSFKVRKRKEMKIETMERIFGYYSQHSMLLECFCITDTLTGLWKDDGERTLKRSSSFNSQLAAIAFDDIYTTYTPSSHWVHILLSYVYIWTTLLLHFLAPASVFFFTKGVLEKQTRAPYLQVFTLCCFRLQLHYHHSYH